MFLLIVVLLRVFLKVIAVITMLTLCDLLIPVLYPQEDKHCDQGLSVLESHHLPVAFLGYFQIVCIQVESMHSVMTIVALYLCLCNFFFFYHQTVVKVQDCWESNLPCFAGWLLHHPFDSCVWSRVVLRYRQKQHGCQSAVLVPSCCP